jgi:hypothetical protein
MPFLGELPFLISVVVIGLTIAMNELKVFLFRSLCSQAEKICGCLFNLILFKLITPNHTVGCFNQRYLL